MYNVEVTEHSHCLMTYAMMPYWVALGGAHVLVCVIHARLRKKASEVSMIGIYMRKNKEQRPHQSSSVSLYIWLLKHSCQIHQGEISKT